MYKLGGRSTYDYTYDVLNRLCTAGGSFLGDSSQSQGGNNKSDYSLTMGYTDTHGIAQKEQLHHKGNFNTTIVANSYDRTYTYEQGTHKINKIEDPTTGFVMNLNYDQNGNTSHVDDTNGIDTDYYWDEANRLRVVDDGQMMHHYIYSAGHERVLKSSSNPTLINENGSPLPGVPITFDNYTTYPSNLIVVKPDGEYTKHYFNGSERILSKIGEEDGTIFDTFTTGGGNDKSVILRNIKQRQKQDLQHTSMNAGKGTVGFKELPETRTETTETTETTSLSTDKAPSASLGNIYFFHGNHLGTASFITDAAGHGYQFFATLPFGETMVEQHSGTEDYENRWKFNGKELDEETGLYYYGARYYNPSTSIWLSVDPLAEMMPSWSSYNFSFSNPLRYKDPDGRAPFDWVKQADNTVVYDSRVTDQASAEAYYGEGSTHIENGTTVTGKLGTEYTLGAGGYWESGGQVRRASDKAPSVYANRLDGSDGVTAASAFTAAAKEVQYSKLFQSWRGSNGKMYNGLSGRGPNQYTGSRGNAKAKAGRIGIGGSLLGGLSVIMTEVDYANSLEIPYGPNMREHLARTRTMDQAANGTGFAGIWGAAASFGYNLGYMIEGTCDCNIQYNPITRDFTPIEQTYMQYDRLGIDLFKE